MRPGQMVPRKCPGCILTADQDMSFNEAGADGAPEIAPRYLLAGLGIFRHVASAAVCPAGDALTPCAESSIIFANSLSKNEKHGCERCPRKRRYVSARISSGSFACLHNGRLPGRGLIALAHAFDKRINPFSRTQVQNQDMIFRRLDGVFQTRPHLSPSPCRQAALKNRQLQPVAVALHGLKDTTPALRLGNVIRHDVEVFICHNRYRGR